MMELGKTVIGLALLALFVFVASSSADPVPVQTYPWPPYPWRDSETVREGRNLLTACHMTPSADLDIYWTKNGSSSFLANGTNLEFVNIGRESSGVYICHAENTTAIDEPVHVMELLTIEVQYPATITRMVLTPGTVHAGDYFMINGTIEGNPYAEFKYINVRTGRLMLSGWVNGVMPVKTNSRCDDFGTWAIQASNFLNEGEWVTQTRELTVICVPEPDPRGGITYQTKSFLRHNATLRMEYVGYPEVSVTWEHNDRVLPSWQQKNDHNSTTLLINHVEVDDFGKYTLKMTNSLGSYTAYYKLNPDGPPQRPFNLEYYDVTYDSVILRWESGFDMGSRQHFTVYQLHGNMYESVSGPIYDTSSTHGIGKHWTYTATGLSSDTAYNLTVESMNADEHYTEGFARPYACFRTNRSPQPYPDEDDGEQGTTIVIGATVGTLVFFGILAFVVYLVKYRHMRTSYIDLSKT